MNKERKILIIVLLTLSVHSFCVFIGLVFMPSTYLDFFGFPYYPENFFQAQGGTFHLVMAVAYFIGMRKPENNHSIIIFSVLAKFIATLFLIGYYFLIQPIWAVLLSGIIDFLMGIVLLTTFHLFIKSQKRA